MSPSGASTLPCSRQSLGAGEPLAGTAAGRVEHWLVLELQSAWEPRVLDCASLKGEVAARLREWELEFPRSRLQLIRRPEVREVPGHEFHVVLNAPDRSRILSGRLSSPAELLDLDLGAILREGSDAAGRLERTDRELVLVCGHGRRDACCAKLGQPIYRRLRELAPEATWMTSHTGGHRFAPTLVHLPSGLCFGRVEEAECEALLEGCRSGRIHDLERVRGRCRFSGAVQAAEVFLRRRHPEFDAVDVEEDAAEDGVVEVVFVDRSGVRRALRVRREALGGEPIDISCAGGKRKPPMAWVALS